MIAIFDVDSPDSRFDDCENCVSIFLNPCPGNSGRLIFNSITVVRSRVIKIMFSHLSLLLNGSRQPGNPVFSTDKNFYRV